MKFSAHLNIYKNIIIIIWWIIVIGFFKIYNDFEFENGSSLIFLGLLIILPLLLYIIGLIRKHTILKQKELKQGKYINLIKKDIANNKIEKEFLKYLTDLHLEHLVIDNQHIYQNDTLKVEFLELYASIKIINTKVVYKFYYTNKFNDYTKYDTRYYQYHPTTRLYSLMVSKIYEIKDKEYIYIESKKGIKLIEQDTKQVVYNLPKNKDKLHNFNQKIKL